METFGRMLLGGFVGAIIIASGMLGLGLLSDYYDRNNIRTFVPTTGAVLGFLVGGITGGLTGLIRPNSKKAVFFALLISAIYVSIILILKSRYLFALFNEGSYVAVGSEIVYLVGFGAALVFSVWLVAKIVSYPKKSLR